MSNLTFKQLLPRIHEIREHQKGIIRVKTLPDLLSTEFDVVSIGARPSGRMHVGNIFVLVNAIHYLQKNPNAKLVFDIMDLDFDNQRGRIFTPFSVMQSTINFIEQVELATKIICESFGVNQGRVIVSLLSRRLDLNTENEKIPTLRSGFLQLFKDPELTKALKYAVVNPTPGRRFKPPVSLICQNCHQSSVEYAVYDSREDRFKANCNNDQCPINEYSTKLDSGEAFNIMYTVDPIRDLLLKGKVVHIFGGDYDQPYLGSGSPKFAAIAAANELAKLVWKIETNSPAFFITNLITDSHGVKVSKSIGNSSNPDVSIERHLELEIDKAIRIVGMVLEGVLSGFTLTHEAAA
ncbi:MAG: hypothetical protein Q7S22_05195 [Candidatus Micrarchaeota archaeon]|nr:hypothetical protein [Candidatus Micrarchaeota archaeon]